MQFAFVFFTALNEIVYRARTTAYLDDCNDDDDDVWWCLYVKTQVRDEHVSVAAATIDRTKR